MLKEHERLDDLEIKDYHVIQSPDGYCFTSDSVMLSNYVNVKKTDKVVDLCTGSGVIALLIHAKFSPKLIYGIEIQPRLADMATRSVKYNGLEESIKIINAPVQGCTKIIGSGFDVVTVNPPYDKTDLVGDKDEYSEKDICKSEVCLTVEECVEWGAKLLKFGGTFYMVNKARRLVDVICAMRNCGIEPKKIRFIQPKASKEIDVFVIEGKKGAKPSLTLPTPLIVYNEDGTYTEAARRIYNK